MTHAVPIIGLEAKRFTNVEGVHFLAGGYLLNALITNNIDLGYIGPGPFIGALSKDIDLIALSASSDGANSFIVTNHKAINSLNDIKHIAVPQIGNTQDLIAKIIFIKNHDYKRYQKNFDYIPINPPEAEMAFFTKSVDAALVAEPWGTVLESKGLINASSVPGLLTESDLDILDNFSAALLVVERNFYNKNKALVDKFILEQNQILQELEYNPGDEHIALIKAHFARVLKKDLEMKFLRTSFNKVKFRNKLNVDALEAMADICHTVKYTRKPVSIREHLQLKGS
jgi:NitT/TauT family transport system substrate-binding protein